MWVWKVVCLYVLALWLATCPGCTPLNVNWDGLQSQGILQRVTGSIMGLIFLLHPFGPFFGPFFWDFTTTKFEEVTVWAKRAVLPSRKYKHHNILLHPTSSHQGKLPPVTTLWNPDSFWFLQSPHLSPPAASACSSAWKETQSFIWMWSQQNKMADALFKSTGGVVFRLST